MNSTTNPWGWRLTALAGMMPAMAGTVGFTLALISMTVRQDSPWLSAMGVHPFTASDIGKWNPGFLSLWKLVNHVGGANLIASGIMISWLSWSGLRLGQRWVRPMIWFLLIWVGGNDTWALLRFRAETGQGFPFAVIAVTLGVAGMWISRKERP